VVATVDRGGDKWFSLFRTESRIRAIPKNWKGWAAMIGFFVWMAAPPLVWVAAGLYVPWVLWHLFVYLGFIAVSLFFWIRLVMSKTDKEPFNKPRFN
jgi:hypothetical protein